MKTALVILIFGLSIAAADNINRTGPYKVGDTVEVWLNVNGPAEWVQSKVMDIKGDEYQIHYGGSRYNLKWVKADLIRNEAREKAAAASKQMQQAFWAEVSTKYAWPVGSFARVLDPNIRGQPTGMPGFPAGAPELAKAMAELAELDGICKAKYAGITNTNEINDYTRMAGTWCKVAASRVEIGKLMVGQMVKTLTTSYLEQSATSRKSIEVRDAHVVAGSWYAGLYPNGYDKVKGISRTSWLDDILDHDGAAAIAEAKQAIGGLYTAIGVTEPTSSFYDDYAKGMAAIKADFTANVPGPVFLATGKDGTMEAAGKQGVTGKILRSAVLSPGWVVTKTPSGKPLDRVKIGTIFYQAASGRCVYRSYAWKQTYAGGGWSAGFAKEANEFYQRCK
ncbi:MAG: hypothetical protein H0V17_01385 [Deltaproteobacteria bacterium]|nr:hypothetical protein [Deltaproteobacteria bacterium]